MSKKDKIKELESDYEILSNEYDKLLETKNTNMKLCFILIFGMIIAHHFGWWGY